MDWKICMMPTYLHGKGTKRQGEWGTGAGNSREPSSTESWQRAMGNGQPALAWCEVCQNGKSWQLRMQSGPLPGWGSMLGESARGMGGGAVRQLTGTKISCNSAVDEQIPVQFIVYPFLLFTKAFAAWLTSGAQKAFEILVYKSQPKRSCLSAAASSSDWFVYLVSVFTLFPSFTRSRCGSPTTCCCLLLEFIVCTTQTAGQ